MIISEFARKTGVSADTLRYYEQLGIIPHVLRNAKGIRVYNTAIEDRVVLIKSLKKCGMSLDDMLMYIKLLEEGDKTLTKRKNLLEHVKETLLQKITAMQNMLRNVDLQM